MTLLDQTLAELNLVEAWEKVRRNAGMAGSDGQGIAEFAHNAFGRLLTLKQQVERREYQPQPLLEIMVPKDSGGERRLAVPAVRDRVLQTACTRVLTPLLEHEMEDASFAYRVKRSVPMAVARVAHYRDRGYQWVVDADIQTFFDEIDHRLLLDKLRRCLDDHSLLPLIELWLAAVVQPIDGRTPYLLTRGVPQGSPISPLLSNLYLDDFDEAMLGRNLRLVRFGDDFVILCRSRNEAEDALEFSEDVIERLKLELKPEKTRITHFDEGFRFLGVDFIRNLMQAPDSAAPWVLPDVEDHVAARPSESDAPEIDASEEETTDAARSAADQHVETVLTEALVDSLRSQREDLPRPQAEPIERQDDPLLRLEDNPAFEPLLRSLLVYRQGIDLYKENERITVVEDGTVQASIPLHKLDHIVLHGNQMISTALLRTAARLGIGIQFADGVGRHVAALDRRSDGAIALHRAQFVAQDDADLARMFAAAFIDGKIHNTRVLLRRLNRRRALPQVTEAEAAIAALQARIPVTTELNRLRGLEGAAAHVLFGTIRHLLPEHWRFPGRRRRPPTDPLNVLLSYGYGVLFANLHTLAERQGLDVRLGYLHASDGRHPALISDLMEEFRSPLVDAVAINLLLNQHLRPEDFVWQGDAAQPCRLTDDARKRYLAALQARLRSGVMHPRAGMRLDWQRLLQYQVWHYARVVMRDEAVYHPYRSK